MVVGELPQEKSLLLSLLLQALWGSREAESENQDGQRGRSRVEEDTQDGRGRWRHKRTLGPAPALPGQKRQRGSGASGGDEGGKWRMMPFPLIFPKTLPKTSLLSSYCFLPLFRLTPTAQSTPQVHTRYGAHQPSCPVPSTTAPSQHVPLLLPGPGKGTHIDSEVLGGAGDGPLG